MNSILKLKTYQCLPFREQEILRYAGCRNADEKTRELLHSCMEEAAGCLTYRVVYRILSLEICEDFCNFELFSLHSRQLAKNLNGCRQTVLFAATIGVGMDRLIAKYSRLSPSKALMFQAIGAGQVEMLCDTFCEEISAQSCKSLRPRFSPGYGDLPLQTQRDIFAVLDCERKIGLTLNDSLLMSPSKSVTAFAGLSDQPETKNLSPCTDCSKTDCSMRKG